MRKKNRFQLGLERLEDRVNPSFNAFFDSLTSTWTLTQVTDDGDITVTVDGAGLHTTDGAGTASYGAAGNNLKIVLLSNFPDNLSVQLDSALPGDLNIQAGSGDRNIDLTGTSNTIGGNLTLAAGNGNQTVDLAVTADLNVGQNATVTLGIGDDEITASNNINVGTIGAFFGNAYFDLSNGAGDLFDPLADVTVGGNLTIRSASVVLGGTTTTGLNFTVANNLESFGQTFSSGGGVDVGDNFTYIGASNFDTVALNSGADTIGGNVYINLGNDLGPSDQTVDVSDAIIGGNVIVFGGFATGVGANNSYSSSAATDITGNLTISFGNSNGANVATIDGHVGGAITRYSGGAGADNVTVVSGAAIDGNLAVSLGRGNGAQSVTVSGATIGGSVSVIAGIVTGGGGNTYTSTAATTIGGSVSIVFGGIAGSTNTATILGVINGLSASYIGGAGTDNVTLGNTGHKIAFVARLGAGSDHFTLNAGSQLTFLFVDFGLGVDIFTNGIGTPLPFPAILRNLP